MATPPLDLDWCLWDMLPHEVTIKTHGGYNSYGEATYSDTRVRRAYVPSRLTVLGRTEFDQIIQGYQIVVADENVTVEDEITLPDGTTPEIAAVEIVDYVDGMHHAIVQFQ